MTQKETSAQKEISAPSSFLSKAGRVKKRLLLIAASFLFLLVFALLYVFFLDSKGGDIKKLAITQKDKAQADCAPSSHKEGENPDKTIFPNLVWLKQPILAPELTFLNREGQKMSLKDFRGQALLLNLWATWCVPCRREMPALDLLEKKLGGQKFHVLAINIDTRQAEKASDFYKKTGIEHLAFYRDDSNEIFSSLKAHNLAFGMPTSLLLDQKGCIHAHVIGEADWGHAVAEKLLEEIIKIEP